MAYYNIVKRPRTDGTIRYRCTVGLKQGGKHVYRETKTFSKLVLAKTWGAKELPDWRRTVYPETMTPAK